MTDEEKAEEYAQNEINKMFVDESEEVYIRASTLKQIIKNSHLKGFTEGRKGKNYFNKFVEKCKENEQLKDQIEKLKCCENSTTTLSGEFISCSLQEEKAALQEAVDKLEAKNKEMHDKITDIIECFISVSSKDDIELSGAAMEIAEILDIKLFR